MGEQKKSQTGFTLLELLIVISVMVVLAAAVILLLDPSETLKRSRDVQRMSDLATIKSAIGIYMTSVAPIYLTGANNSGCRIDEGYISGSKIYYSYPRDGKGKVVTDTTLDGGVGQVPEPGQVASADGFQTNGQGWLPVNLAAIPGKSPVSFLPIDPINLIDSPDSISGSDLVYRYACNSTHGTYEMDARLESELYREGGTDDRSAIDGGNNSHLYEVGTQLDILGPGLDF